jgi:uncharacterized protein YggE
MRSAILITALGLAGCADAPDDPRGVDRAETLLTVTASGRAETRPDEARLQLGVQSLSTSAGDASRMNREKMERVVAALRGMGVRPEQIQTRNVGLQRIDYGPERGRFRADNVVEATMHDMARVGEAITAVTEAGANVLSGPELRVRDREKANLSAYAAAYRAARARAQAYAGAADLRIGRVLGIYDGGEYGIPTPHAPPPPPVVRTMATEQSASVPFSPGMNASEVRVRVDFALTKA